MHLAELQVRTSEVFCESFPPSTVEAFDHWTLSTHGRHKSTSSSHQPPRVVPATTPGRSVLSVLGVGSGTTISDLTSPDEPAFPHQLCHSCGDSSFSLLPSFGDWQHRPHAPDLLTGN